VQSELAEVIRFPLLAERVPAPPPAALDPVLDATEACIVRHGLAKTSLSDIARELGVAPSTVYRKVGTVENAALLVMGRESHRLLAELPEVIAGVEGPRVITVFLAASIERTASHPMAAKILRDEIEWMGRLMTRRMDELLTEGVATVTPLLEAAMANGTIRRQDPEMLAHWIMRIGMTCLLAPPPGKLVDALDALLLPMLEPTPPAPKPSKRKRP